MRAYTIALFILIFALMQSVVQEMGIFPTGIPSNDADSLANVGTRMIDNMTAVGGDMATNTGFTFGLVGFAFKLGHVIYGTFINLLQIHGLLTSLGIPEVFAVAIQGIVLFVLAMGLFQLWSNRGVKNYE